MVIKFRIRLRCIKGGEVWKAGEEMILFNEPFNIDNGIAFWAINRDIWEITHVEQYTGSKGKDDKEIYYKDILRSPHTGKIYWVSYSGGMFYGLCKGDKRGRLHPGNFRTMEVIGNLNEKRLCGS